MGNTKSLHFTMVDSHMEMRWAFSLRFRVYCLEKRFLAEGDYPDGLEMDELDDHSVHFAAYHGNDIIGYCRLVLPNPHGFPFQQHFQLGGRAPRLPTSTELSRLIVTPSMRSLSDEVLMGLVEQVHHFHESNNLSDCYVVIERPLLRMLRRFGLPFEVMSEATWCYNSMNLLARTSKDEIDTQLIAGTAPFCAYMKSETGR